MFRTCTLWAITKILNKALTALTILTLASVAPASVLENPAPNGHYSGIGIISGWKCDAGELTVRFDGGNAIPLTHGSERADTLPICGVIDTGFVSLFNWNLLSDGEQTAIVYDDGIEFARATFTVTRPGIDFLRGITGSGTARLGNGLEVTLAWSEAQQSFVATRFHNPIAGSGPESGGSSALPLDIVCEGWGEHGFISHSDIEWVERCLAAGADPNAELFGVLPHNKQALVDRNITPIHHQAHKLYLLLAAGGDPNRSITVRTPFDHLPDPYYVGTRKPEERTLLDNAIRGPSRLVTLRVLLDAGADPNARSERLHCDYVDRVNYEAHVQKACLIIQAGGRVDECPALICPEE